MNILITVLILVALVILAYQSNRGNTSLGTDTINSNQQEIVDLKRDLKVAEDKIVDQNTRLTSAESTWQMAENLYRQLADQVREHDYDIKDLNR